MTPLPKKPSLLKQAKDAAPQASTTERFDNFKKQQLVKSAESEVVLRPDSSTAKQQLDQAINVEYAYKRYRETLNLVRSRGGGQAKTFEAQLKQLRALLDEDVSAAGEVPPSLDALLDLCDDIRQALP